MGAASRLVGIKEIPAWEKDAPVMTGRLPGTPTAALPVTWDEMTWPAAA
jgi:hypothetical protein